MRGSELLSQLFAVRRALAREWHFSNSKLSVPKTFCNSCQNFFQNTRLISFNKRKTFLFLSSQEDDELTFLKEVVDMKEVFYTFYFKNDLTIQFEI